jgi:carboxymethylenebutenolidase
MCFDFDSRPPALPADLAPMAGGAAAEPLELASADGTRVAAALAAAPESRGAGVVILPDVRGLYRFYTELAERFAEAGHHAIAIDYFGRTAGAEPRDGDFDYMPHVAQTTVAQVEADTAAAIDALRERTAVGPVATVGFCFGGRSSFLAATGETPDIAGAVGFYGLLTGGRLPGPAVLDEAGDTRVPVLGLFGGEDQAIPLESVEAYDEALDATGVAHEIVVYPGAPHSFFDRKQAEHAEASEDAWRRTLAFLGGL